MPGFHACIRSSEDLDAGTKDSILSSLRATENKVLVIDEGKNHILILSSEFFYPFLQAKHLDGFCILDGIVYNRSGSEILDRLNSIYLKMEDDAETTEQISRFVTDADGDYVVIIRNKNRWIVFNDMYARMATYYYCTATFCVVSRELKSILAIAKEVEIDRVGLVEYLALRYPLGNKTLFKHIFRLEPSELLRVDLKNTGVNLLLEKTAQIRYDTVDRYPDTFTAQQDLVTTLSEGAQSRILAARGSGAKIVADLSGGFDTRAIMGLLSGITQDVEYVSIKLSTGDESAIARQLWQAAGKPGHFTALDVEHAYSLADADELILENDGLVNYNTTIVCERDIRSLRNHLGLGDFFRFGGLGGEFIRHPMKLYTKSLHYGYRRGLYSQVIDRVCNFARIDAHEYLNAAQNYLSSYPEQTTEGKLRRWYYEYYNHFVGAAAEDRERTVIWTVHPFWQKDFLTKVFTRVPLEWTGYEFFTSVMKIIDPRLLHAPIFKRDIELNDLRNLIAYDQKNKVEIAVESKKAKMALVKDWIKALGLREKDRPGRSTEVTRTLESLLYESNCASKLFDIKALLRHFELHPGQRTMAQVVTIVRYFDNLESKKEVRVSY